MASSSAREPEETKDSKELSLDEQVAAALARVDAFDADLGKAKSGMREMTREIGGIMGKIVSATKGRERDYLEELETIEESSDLSAEERRAVMPSAMREEMAAELRLVALPALDECYIASVRHERILLTAPHSVAVVRDDDDIHCAEKWTALITLKLAVAFNELLTLNPAVCVWNLFKGCDVSNLDPNYLSAKDLEFSPFHKALHAFRHYNVHNPDSYVETVAKSTVTVDEAVDSAVTDEMDDAKDDSSAVDASSAKRLFADCCVASDSSTATTTPPLSPVMFACDIHGRGDGKTIVKLWTESTAFWKHIIPILRRKLRGSDAATKRDSIASGSAVPKRVRSDRCAGCEKRFWDKSEKNRAPKCQMCKRVVYCSTVCRHLHRAKHNPQCEVRAKAKSKKKAAAGKRKKKVAAKASKLYRRSVS